MAISNCETWNEPKVWREKQEVESSAENLIPRDSNMVKICRKYII